jgi:hypothetical protein
MSTGNEGLIFALGHMQGKRYAKNLGDNARRRRRQRQAQPQASGEGCLMAIAKGFLWLTFWGRLTLVIVAPIILVVAS